MVKSILRAMAVAAVLAGTAAVAPAVARPASRFVPLGEAADAPSGFLEMCARDSAACGGKAVVAAAASNEPAGAVACVGAASAWPDADPSLAAAPPERFVSPFANDPAPARGCYLAATGAFSTAALAPAPAAETRGLREKPAAGRVAGSFALVERINRHVNRSVIQQSDLSRFGVEEFWQRSGDAPGAAGDCEDIALEKRAELAAAGFAQDRLFLAVVFRHEVGLHTVLVARMDDGDVVLDSLTGAVLPWNATKYRWVRVQRPGDGMKWVRADQG